jgi:predicted nucleic acid-binding Zn ribbon protein
MTSDNARPPSYRNGAGYQNRGGGSSNSDNSAAQQTTAFQQPEVKTGQTASEKNANSTNRYASAYKPHSYQPPDRPRAFRPRGDLTAVRGILNKILARKGLAAKVSKYEFIMHWPEIVGPAFVTVSKPECILKDTLIVRVISSGWAQEMGFVKPILLQKLARYLPPGQSVREVTFRVGPL